MNMLGIIGYGFAALAFGILSILLWMSWKGGKEGSRFVTAAAISALWSLLLLYVSAREDGAPFALVFTAEMLRDGAWLIALASAAHGVLPRRLARLSQLLCFGLIAVVWLLPILFRSWSADRLASTLLIPAGIAAAILVLLLLEQIYRNANSQGRYGFKYLAIGLGGIYAFDLFLYSQAELLRSISTDFWQLRGFVNALLVPMIAVAARRNPQWSLDVFVSRQAVLFTASIGAVGAYLLLMSLGGYYIRNFGGSWGAIANLLFVVGAIVVLAVVLVSGSVRRRLRVFVHKHFYRNKYDYRIEWLRFVASLSVADNGDLRRSSLQAIAQVFESDGALLFLRSESAPHYVASAAIPWQVTEVAGLQPVAPEHEMIIALRDRKWVIDLREIHEAPEFYQNLELPEWLLQLQGYRMVAPLLHGTDLVGFVVLREPAPPFIMNYEDRDLLLTMGRHVALILTQQDSERRLGEVRQFEAYHRLTAFMMHDLKNIVAQLNLVVSNSVKHRHNPEFVDDSFATVANTAERMTQLIGQLSGKQFTNATRPVDLNELLQKTVLRCQDRDPKPLVHAVSAQLMTMADAARLSSVIEHVVRNAQDASKPDGVIEVSLSTEGNRHIIQVRDFGAGMTAEFLRTRLFRPFDSTKGSKGMGVGAYQVMEYVRSLGGDVEVQSSPHEGTHFFIKLPKS
jgi:putative PEP-CTERM system histidine kinase